MGFILKIYFFGLIAFVPNTDGKQMTALVIDARPGFHASDGSAFPEHYPVLLAKAGNCQGDCQSQAKQVANHLFGTGRLLNPELTMQGLRSAIGEKGGAWELNGDHITVRTAATARADAAPGLTVVRNRRGLQRDPGEQTAKLPATLQEAEDFSWVAEIERIVPTAGKVDPDCLAETPKKDLVVGRVKLTEGSLKTHRLVQFDKSIPSFVFRPFESIAPGARAADYSQGLADWTVAEIPVAGCEVTITARNFATGETRSMTLSPTNCQAGNEVVEAAVMNVPDPSKRHEHGATRGNRGNEPQAVGAHFELFYELAESRPTWKQKAVPHVSLTATVKPSAVDPGDVTFLKVLDIPRAGTYSQPICPQAVFTADPNG